MTVPPIESYDEIDSTNAEARRRAEAGETGPVWITALTQTAGRGRRGRDWQTRAGNLAATLLFATDKPVGQAAQISCLGPGAVTVKWPNDLLIHGRKAVGILVESGPLPDGRLWLAVGIGINLAHAPQDVERPAAAFAEFMPGPPPSPRAALEVLAQAFERWRTAWEREGFAAIAKGWTERAHGLGQPCEARLPNQTHRGVAEGLDPDGALRLRLDDGAVLRITAGDVFFGET